MDKFEQEEATPHRGTNPVHVFPHNTKNRSALKAVGIVGVLLVLGLLVAGVAYLWQVVESKQYEIAKKEEKITLLNEQIAELTNAEATKSSSEAESTIVIRELGIAITVPDSIEDLTYAYTAIKNQDGTTVEVAGFSTKSLTELYDGSVCSSQDSPLGKLIRVDGQYQVPTNVGSPTTLVKQFDDSYIAYSGPQAYCGTDSEPAKIAAAESAAKTFEASLASVEQVK